MTRNSLKNLCLKTYLFRRSRLLFLIIGSLVGLNLSAQTTVSGNVTDTTGEPLIGVTVVEKGTQNGVMTDLDGNYQIKVASTNASLVFSYVGCTTQTIPLKGRTTLDVVMEDNQAVLDEVVVVGYGTMRKRDLSGAMSQIKSEDLMKGGATDISHALQGKLAGVQIQQSDGAPGGGVTITVRGANSFQTNSQPLYIVDGVPFETGDTPSNSESQNQSTNPLSFINPNDIESIEVLKDASATAIYGSRGANGVVIVNTKKGKAGTCKVDLSVNMTFSRVARKMDMLNPFTYANYCNEEVLNSRFYEGSKTSRLAYDGRWTYKVLGNGRTDYSSGTYTPKPEDFLNPGWYRDEYGNYSQVGVANWQDLIYQTGFTQDYNLSVSGGDEKGYYMFSGSFADQKGIIKNTGYMRYTLRANIARHINNLIEIGTNTSFTYSKTDFAKTSSDQSGVIRSALLFPPTYDPMMDETTADNLSWLAANPWAYVNNAKDQVKGINWFSSNFIELTFTDYLKFRQNLGLSYTDSHRGFYYDRTTSEGKAPVNGKGGNSSDRWQGVTAESILTFDKTFKEKHKLNLMGAFTFESGSWNYESVVATNFPDDMTKDYDMSRALDKAILDSSNGTQRLVSFLARANYTYNYKYLFTASVRTDGSSKFITKNKWATFLSGAVAWRLGEEEFIKKLEFFQDLKIRASYGETGNQGIGAYRTLPQLGTSNYPFGGSLNSGTAMTSDPVSSDLKWETTRQYNFGIDVAMWLDGRLHFTVDYYKKNTRNLLQDVVIPGSSGFQQMTVNMGNVSNEGVEITAGFNNILRSTRVIWDISGNITWNKSKISGLPSDQFARKLWSSADEVFIQRNGCPIGAIYGYVEDGFYDNEAEVRADPMYVNATDATVKAMVGEIKYRDLDGDGKITAENDRCIIGDTNPDFIYGITNNLTWNNFTLSFMFQGTHGNDIFNGNLMDVKLGNVGNIPRFAYDSRWTPENAQNAEWPKATAGYSRDFKLSNRYVEDGSYFKLKNITVGYNWMNPVKGISSVRFSFTATNVFTVSKYSWLDPDVNAFGGDSSRRGVDIYSYPSARTYALGIVLSF